MRFIKIIFLIYCSVYFPIYGNSQIAFRKVYSNNGYDYGQGIVQLADSSYVICGSSSSFLDGPSQAFLLKIDSLGNYIWSNHYGGSETDWGRRVLYHENTGFLVAGFTNSIGNGGYDAYLFKTDLSGQLLWEKSYGGSGWERINDAVLTVDNGAFLVGESNSTVNGDNDMYLLRTNVNGDTLWSKKLGGLGDDKALAVDRLNDSTYFVAGETYITDSLLTKGFVLRIKDDGVIEWMDTLGSSGNYGVRGIDLDVVSNKVSFVGWQQDTNDVYKNSMFGKLTYQGILDFEQVEIPSSGEKIIEHLTNYGSQGKNYMCFRYFDETSFNDGYDVGVSKVMAGLYWDGLITSINYPLEDEPGEIIPTSDGGAIYVGYSTGIGIGGGNVYVMKIGPNDNFPLIEFNPVPFSLVGMDEQYITQTSSSLYPNPFNEKLTINTGFSQDTYFEVSDIYGKIITNGFFKDSISILTGDWHSGIYFIKTVQGNQEFQFKSIKY